MEVIYSEIAQEHILYWKRSGNKNIQTKIQEIIDDIKKDFYNGIGKPEPLKHKLSGFWSRRINKEHRIIYQVDKINNKIFIYALKGHYES
jgi:toxin YoeB